MKSFGQRFVGFCQEIKSETTWIFRAPWSERQLDNSFVLQAHTLRIESIEFYSDKRFRPVENRMFTYAFQNIRSFLWLSETFFSKLIWWFSFQNDSHWFLTSNHHTVSFFKLYHIVFVWFLFSFTVFTLPWFFWKRKAKMRMTHFRNLFAFTICVSLVRVCLPKKVIWFCCLRPFR